MEGGELTPRCISVSLLSEEIEGPVGIFGEKSLSVKSCC